MNAGRRMMWSVGLLCLSVSGCALYRAGEPSIDSVWPPKTTADGPPITVYVGTETSLNGRPLGATLNQIETFRDETIRAYRGSGLFSSVTPGLSPTGLRAEVRIIDRQEMSWPFAILTGLTLYIIPSATTDEYIVKTAIRNSAGQVVGVFEKSEGTVLWQQLFLIFVMPFHSPWAVQKDVIYDLNRATLLEAHGKGLF